MTFHDGDTQPLGLFNKPLQAEAPPLPPDFTAAQMLFPLTAQSDLEFRPQQSVQQAQASQGAGFILPLRELFWALLLF